MIDVEGLSKHYADVEAVRDIDFHVESGDIFGLVGPNGAGKTSTLKMLAGLVEPTAGTIDIDGRHPDDPKMRKQLGFLPEESPLYDDMTPQGYLEFFASLYDVPKDVAKSRITEALDRLELDARDRVVGDFSKGMKRKVAIARSLVNDPAVLIYDEPASGLDPLTTNTVVEFTRELADQDKTIIFSAHDLYHVERVCDRVGIMNEGQIRAIGTVKEIRGTYGDVEYRVFTDVPVEGATQTGSQYVSTVSSMDDVESIREMSQNAGGNVVDIRTQESSLEDVFLDVTGGSAIR
ncbi:ABC transporter ATP-binding protein [Halodesulfurarchaeum sp.]|uniref:ABC transporter ATP-binding protein n=1 Tax=Halodesulfurarchaeum sp. TaxID=1980530 RepID=UPI002FC3C307